MFKMAKKPMYRLKNGPQNLQRDEGCSADFEERRFYVSVFVRKPSVVNFT